MEKSKMNEMTKELHISLNMPSMCIEKTELNKIEYLRIEINNLSCQVNDLRTSLKIHKEIVHNLLVENGGNQQFEVIECIFNEMQRIKEKYELVFEEKQRLEANCLLLEQINDEIKFKEKESEVILNSKIKELNEAIERKEFLFQLKEQKWTCIEKVMVDYAREDIKLQRMLADLRYICDDVSTRRNVKNVIQENEELKEIIEDKNRAIAILAQKLQETLTSSQSNEVNYGVSEETKNSKLPDINCFNFRVVKEEIVLVK